MESVTESVASLWGASNDSGMALAQKMEAPKLVDDQSGLEWFGTIIPTEGVNGTVAPLEDLVHPYWKQFDIESIPPSWHYLVALWMTVFGIMGILGNLLVIYTFATTRGLRTPPNMLIISLAIGDLGFSAVNGFPLLTISSINKRWVWGRAFCQFYGFIGGWTGLASICTHAYIAMDRYLVITRPMSTSGRLSKNKAMGVITFIWAWCLLWSLLPFMGYGDYIPEGFQTSCTFDYLTQTVDNYIYVYGMYLCCFMAPLGVIIGCYVGIISSVFEHRKMMMATAAKMGAKTSKDDKEKKAEIAAAKVAAIIVAAYCMAWTPYAFVALLGITSDHSSMVVTPLLSEIPVMFAKASASINPIIYAISHPKFRTQIDNSFPWLLACCRPSAKELNTDTSASVTRTAQDQQKNGKAPLPEESTVCEAVSTVS